MGVREDEPDDEGEVEAAFPFAPGPPNRGRHRDPAPRVHGFGRRRTTTARHNRPPNNHRY
jgi:hypothetical protein